MNPERKQAIDYLLAPAGAPWRWAEGGSVIIWQDGSTIAFRGEIVQLLECLGVHGLPSFGAIVFFLAACRGKFPIAQEIALPGKSLQSSSVGDRQLLLSGLRTQLLAQVEAALVELKRLADFEPQLKAGGRAKCVLAEAVFEPAKAERHIDVRDILRGMEAPIGDEELNGAAADGSNSNFVRQLHVIAEGLRLHTPETLALRLKTGLDGLPGSGEAQLSLSERASQLIETLLSDPELAAVGRAAKDLLAAVHLPRKLSNHDESLVGGVADIMNRGPLDRLLLSELAYDDLTLAVRVALNEALYLRREPLQKEPPGTLALLLDSGIRLWGVPRVLAAAAALALAARDRRAGSITAWRAQGQKLVPVDLLSRTGLIAHLGALETEAHPGAAIEAFVKSKPGVAGCQSVVLTHRDALDDPEFRQLLAASSRLPSLIATVDGTGRFELHGAPFGGRRPLCESDLDLNAVLGGNTGLAPVQGSHGAEWPAIFGVVPFPFLLPLAGSLSAWAAGGDGYIYAILGERLLVQFKDAQSGARTLASDLPSGKTLWMEVDGGTVYAVKSSTSHRPARLLTYNLPGGPFRISDLAAGPEVRAVHRCGGVLLLIRNGDVRAHALSDGHFIETAVPPHRWVSGRYFAGGSDFMTVVWDGGGIAFAPLIMPKLFRVSVIAAIFDRTGMDGPWIVHRSGTVFSTATGEEISVPMPDGVGFGVEVAGISRDGHRVCLTHAQRKWARLKDLKTGAVTEVPHALAHKAQLDVPPALPVRNLFRVLEYILPLADGLALRGRKKAWRKIELRPGSGIHIMPASIAQSSLAAGVAISAESRVTPHACSVQAAQFPNGSRAWLDSRGILHLKSHREEIPEVSLVLGEGEIAGWTSDGHVCGPPFFFGEPRHSEPERVFDRLMRFIQAL